MWINTQSVQKKESRLIKRETTATKVSEFKKMWSSERTHPKIFSLKIITNPIKTPRPMYKEESQHRLEVQITFCSRLKTIKSMHMQTHLQSKQPWTTREWYLSQTTMWKFKTARSQVKAPQRIQMRCSSHPSTRMPQASICMPTQEGWPTLLAIH